MTDYPSKHIRWAVHAIRGSIVATVLFLAAVVGVILWVSSAGFEQLVRWRLISGLENSIGGRVEIASFHWHPFKLEAEANDIIIHGLEPPTEDPYARIQQLHVAIRISGLFWTPSILLRELDITHPVIHLIVNPDGSTNQPHPKHKHKSSNTALDQLFRLEAGRCIVSNGIFRLNKQSVQLNLDAHDLSLNLSYQPANPANPESYHLEAAASNLHIARGINMDLTKARTGTPPANFRIATTLDFTRTAASLRSLSLVSNSHELDVTGSLQNFSQPSWKAQFTGELEMGVLQPLFEYADAPQGVAHINVEAVGKAGTFRADGPVHVDDAIYSIVGVEGDHITVDAHAHADPNELYISGVTIKLQHGGTLTGELTLRHWLPPVHGSASIVAQNSKLKVSPRSPQLFNPDQIDIPVDGTIKAQINGISIDSILEVVTPREFHRLGLDGLVNGPMTADWKGGDVNTLRVGGKLAIAPSSNPLKGEVASTGFVDGTYTQSNGAVDLRAFDLQLPASHILAHGHLGAYPIQSPMALAVDFHSTNLWEFDAILRSLDFTMYKLRGAAALPILLRGQSSFKGTWGGSLLDPHMTGVLSATNLSIMMPAKPGDPPEKLQWSPWDKLDMTGTYSATHVVVDSSRLVRGTRSVELAGSLDAVTGPFPPKTLPEPDFDAASMLHLRAKAQGIPLDDIFALTGQTMPITGTVAAEFEGSGPLRSLVGKGWADLTAAKAYGEPITRVHAQGTIAGTNLNFSNLTVDAPAGSLSASGSYDYKSQHYTLDARGSGIELSAINTLHHQVPQLEGRLSVIATGAGTLSDPVLNTRSIVLGLSLGDSSAEDSALKTIVPGRIEFTANAANHVLTYYADARIQDTALLGHGLTHIGGDYQTETQLNFTNLNIGTLINFTHLQRLNGETALDGVVTVEGPLAHPRELKGDLHLSTLTADIQGVHLSSQGSAHATLANSRITLDPLHITGDDTDLHAQGDITLQGDQPINLAADGTINLKLAETIDHDLIASGMTTFKVEAHGTLANPGLIGKIKIQNGALALADLPNGLSQINGALEFNQNRLEVRTLTAMSGGGLLTLNGYLAYQNELYSDISVTGKSIRIRYPQGVSSLGDATLHLQGTQSNMLLSGNVLINRFSLNPGFDMAALAAQATAIHPVASFDSPSNHLRLDVHLVSAPQLNFQNGFAKLAGNVDLHLRGTVATPSVLGRISITEGSATIAGTRYDLERGDILFNNPVRIQPTIDLNATSRVEDYDITLGIHGTIEKPTISYRSEPPLPESDVIALLALGHTQDQQRIYTQQQESANPITDTLLSGALNASVSSRVQKLFGAGSVKVDPSYLGAEGTTTSRITVEEQLGRAVTLTFATNANSTSQQLIQAEIAINRHVSILLARDESGVFSMVLKATRRFK